jgi:hypothetical protein
VPVTTTIGLDLPAPFPVAAYDGLNQRVAAYTGAAGDAWPHWASSWNAVAHRYLAAFNYSRDFADSITTPGGDAPPPTVRFEQERALFGFFASACSVLESFAYAAHALGAAKDRNAFPVSEPEQLRRIGVVSTRKKYRAFRPNSEFTVALSALVADPTYRDLSRFRNVLVHRSATTRIIYRGLGQAQQDPPATWDLTSHGMVNYVLDASFTELRLAWLENRLPLLVTKLDEFGEAELR